MRFYFACNLAEGALTFWTFNYNPRRTFDSTRRVLTKAAIAIIIIIVMIIEDEVIIIEVIVIITEDVTERRKKSTNFIQRFFSRVSFQN